MVLHGKYIGLTNLTKDDVATLQQVSSTLVDTLEVDQTSSLLNDAQVKSSLDSPSYVSGRIAPLSIPIIQQTYKNKSLVSSISINYQN